MHPLEVRDKEGGRLNIEHTTPLSGPPTRSPVAIFGRTLRTLYLLSALLYTFWYLVTSQSAWSVLGVSKTTSPSLSSTANQAARATASHPHVEEAPVLSWAEWGRLHGVEWNKDVISWKKPSSTSEDQNGSFSTPEDYFLSKAFGESLQPSKVIPYYYRATNEIPKEDITITTLVTSDRFKVLAALVQKYRGERLALKD